MTKYNVVRNEAHEGLTATFSANAAAGHALKVSGVKTVAPATAADMTVGVSHHDVDVAVHNKGTMRLRGDVIPMIADAAVTAGAKLVPGATAGRVKTAAAEDAALVIGVAWTTATAAGEEVLVIVL